MKLATTVTLFVGTVLFLANSVFAEEVTVSVASSAPAASMAASPAQTSTAAVKPVKKPSSPTFGISATLSRSTSLIDFQDGSRSDGMDIQVVPSIGFSSGKLSAVFAYAQNLRDEYAETENDFADVPVTWSFKGTPLNLFDSYDSKISYSMTAVAPASKLSTKRDQLQTSLSGKIGFSLTPKDEGFTASAGVTAGRNFHAYETDINGNVLNQYSSNQTLSLGYGIGSWSVGIDYIHRTRWTYRGNIKTSFGLSEEIGYSINDNFAVAVGHSNEGSTLKANGADSNIDFFNENSSMVYGSLSLSY
ncbi:MAG: hypothetical protein K0R29_1845 [Pseudobdellovibrio sp.]|jgi:hypothetical protein|nr:hypothetical protein [Pseudobdellovibrio sp.]